MKILFITPYNSPFIEQDLKILEQEFEVKEFKCKSLSGWGLIKENIKYLFFLPYYFLKGYRKVFIWFADYHSLVPTLIYKLLGGKSYIVIGGMDVVSDKTINYGSHQSKIRSLTSKWSMRLAGTLLAVSKNIEKELVNTFKIKQDKIIIIYNCLAENFSRKKPESSLAKKGFLTICSGSNLNRKYIKGLDRFLEVAKLFPENTFTIVGPSGELYLNLNEIKPDNAVVVGPKKQQDLGKIYDLNKYICQFSRYESFGIAVLEGIAHGCVPIVSNTGGLTEIVENDENILRQPDDLIKTKSAITSILNNISLSDIDVQIILNKFSFEKRHKLLKHLLSDA